MRRRENSDAVGAEGTDIRKLAPHNGMGLRRFDVDLVVHTINVHART
jgi:hypothetical protein